MNGREILKGTVSAGIALEPRAAVTTPLVAERAKPGLGGERLRDFLSGVHWASAVSALLPRPWQQQAPRLQSDRPGEIVWERFVGVTLREILFALHVSGSVLPLDIVRTVSESVFQAFSPLSALGQHPRVTDRSIGLSVCGQWRFAPSALNLWLMGAYPRVGEQPVNFVGNPEHERAQVVSEASIASLALRVVCQLISGRSVAGGGEYSLGRETAHLTPHRSISEELRAALQAHPSLTARLSECLMEGLFGVRFSGLKTLTAALATAWPEPAAAPARAFSVLTGACWHDLRRELERLKANPLLPLTWAGVWTNVSSPELGLQVLEDQLLDQLAPRGSLHLRRVP